jgi:hypothetical protein
MLCCDATHAQHLQPGWQYLLAAALHSWHGAHRGQGPASGMAHQHPQLL